MSKHFIPALSLSLSLSTLMFIHFRRAGLWSNAPFWLLALFISLCIARGVATYNVGLRSCCWQLRYWQNHMDLISYSSRQTPEKQVRAIRVFVRRRGNVAFAWQKVRKKREEARWVCVPLDLNPIRSIFFCVCVWGGDCFRDSAISGCHHHSSSPKVSGMRCCHASRYCWSILIDLRDFREYQCPSLPLTPFCLCN